MHYNNKQLHILEFAAHEFLKEGYAAASTNTISKKAVVAKGLIFHYFKNKEQLYQVLLTYAFENVKIKLYSQLKTLSTYMEPFELITELIYIKAELPYYEPLYGPLLINSFTITTDLPASVITTITALKQQFEAIFTSFLNGLFMKDLKPTFKHEQALYHQLLILLEAAFLYEKSILMQPLKLADIRSISLTYYEKMLKDGILVRR